MSSNFFILVIFLDETFCLLVFLLFASFAFLSAEIYAQVNRSSESSSQPVAYHDMHTNITLECYAMAWPPSYKPSSAQRQDTPHFFEL